MSISRREFLAATTAGSLALSAPTLLGANSNKKYRTALIGSGWWGMNILSTAIQSGSVDVVAMCDVDRNQLDPAAKKVEQMTGSTPKKYKDYRELLEEQKPEIAIVATPDHWHPLAMIEACKVGAHVYVEKPVSHKILEGAAMVQTARETNRVVQVGTHRRVSPHNVSGMKFLKDGKAGKIGMVRAFVHYGGGPGNVIPDADVPDGLDWDFWCGPAPMRPFNPKIHPKGFRSFLDYANGTLGDWGIHWLDQILWWTEEKYPKTVYSTGGRPICRDNTDAPDSQVANFEFESFTATWEHRRFAHNRAEKHNIGVYFYGTEGTFHMGWRDGWTFYPVSDRKPILHEEPQLRDPDGQNIPELWDNFIRCIESGDRPECDIEIGHRSTAMSLLGMLSLKLGRSVAWDGENNTILGDEEACRLLRRTYREPWKYPELG